MIFTSFWFIVQTITAVVIAALLVRAMRRGWKRLWLAALALTLPLLLFALTTPKLTYYRSGPRAAAGGNSSLEVKTELIRSQNRNEPG